MREDRMRCIAVANEKGGVGKTVTVVNLGAALTLENKSVLILDMDPQANATRGMGIEIPENAPTVYDLITNNADMRAEDLILESRWENLHLLPSSVDLSGAEVELVNEEGRENRLKDALDRLNLLAYDFILVDTPPSLSLLTINVFAAADEVLVPCQTHPYAFAALEELFDTIFAIREEINPELGITGIVPTLYDQRTRVCRKVLEQLHSDERYRDKVYDTTIRFNSTIAESADIGKPVVFYRRSSYGYIDYNALAEELLARA